MAATKKPEMSAEEVEYHNKVIAEQLKDARYLTSEDYLTNQGPLSGLRMALDGEFIDWGYVAEKADIIIRRMEDVKRIGKVVREHQKALRGQ